MLARFIIAAIVVLAAAEVLSPVDSKAERFLYSSGWEALRFALALATIALAAQHA